MTDEMASIGSYVSPERVVCVRCQKTMRAGSTAGVNPAHGICDDCVRQITTGGAFDGALASLPVPVVVTNEDLLILGANPAAESLLGKSDSQMINLKAGAAIDCRYARLNGGCGTTEHCRSCTVRHSVGATYADGKPRYGVVAHQELMSGELRRTVQVRFSTAKLKSLLLVLIEEVRILGTRPDSRHPLGRIFAEEYCAAHFLPPDRFLPAMFRGSMTWWARVLVPALRLTAADFFAADRELLTAVGLARRPEDVFDAIAEFQAHPANRRLLRRVFRLRVSCGRLMQIYAETSARAERPPPS